MPSHMRAARREYVQWLPALPLVQMHRSNKSVALPAAILTHLTIIVLPLVLIFLLDVSFLRYQSFGITIYLHIISLAEVIAVYWYLWQFKSSNKQKMEFTRVDHPFNRILAVLRKATCSLRITPTIVVTVAVTIVLWIYAWPPTYDHTPTSARNESPLVSMLFRSWCLINPVRVQCLTSSILGNPEEKDISEDFNFFDDFLCGSIRWRGFCRHLNIRGNRLSKQTAGGRQESILELLEHTEVDELAGESRHIGNYDMTLHNQLKYGLNLEGRSLKYAVFDDSWMPAARFSGADLRGATLKKVYAPYGDFSGALLTGASLQGAMVAFGDFQNTHMNYAILSLADMRQVKFAEASVFSVEAWKTRLQKAKLSGVDLNGSYLYAENLREAELDEAQLNATYLSQAELQGADLSGAYIFGTTGKALTDGKTNTKNIRLGKQALKQIGSKAKGGIPCIDEAVKCVTDKYPKGSRLAWNRHMEFGEYLGGEGLTLGLVERVPSWLKDAVGEGPAEEPANY